MCTYVNLETQAKIKALRIIVRDHDKMLKEATADTTITQSVKNLVTGYHRTKRDDADAQIKELGGLPVQVPKMIHSDSPILGFQDV